MKAYNDIQNSIDTAKEEGREAERKKIAESMLAMGLTPEQVAKGTDLPLEEVKKLQQGN